MTVGILTSDRSWMVASGDYPTVIQERKKPHEQKHKIENQTHTQRLRMGLCFFKLHYLCNNVNLIMFNLIV